MAEKVSRNHYSDFVAHMIRFYISCPDGIPVQGHTRAEVNNWIAAQAVFADLDAEEARLLTDIYRRKNLPFPEAVKLCAKVHCVKENEAWKLVTRVNARIARVRGLV